MIELLILYILNTRDKTIYAIRREIIELFGMFTQPSLGTIHPALKRLLAKDAVKFEKKFSEGGKKSTYYSITPEGKKVFKELFFEDISSNPSLFYTQLMSRILTVSMLDKEDKTAFWDELSKNVDIQRMEVEKALQNPYVSYDAWQKAVILEVLNNANSLAALVERLKTY